MAYILNTTKTALATSGATYAVTPGTHATNDLLLCGVVNDQGSTNISFGNTTATLTAATDLVTYAGSDIFANGDQIEITTSGNLTGTGLALLTRYWVRDIDTTANTFKLAATSGGAAIDITGAGSGTHTFHLMVSTTSGWAIIGTQAAVNRHVWAYKVAASGAETGPTFTGTSTYWYGACLVVRDANATTPFGALVSGTDYIRSDYTTGTTHASNEDAALTTAVDKCLLIYSWGIDGNQNFARCKLSDVNSLFYQTNNYVGQMAAGASQETAGVAPTVTAYFNANTAGHGWVLAIRNATNGATQPMALLDANSQELWYGSWAAHAPNPTWQAPSNFAATIDTLTVSTTAPTVAATAVVTGDWGNMTSIGSTEASASSIWVGGTHTITSTDMAGKVVSLLWATNYTTATAVYGTKGFIVGFSDGTYWVTYRIAEYELGWFANFQYRASIAVGNAVEYCNSEGTTSSSINWGAITRIAFMLNRLRNDTALTSFYLRDFNIINKWSMTGGGSSRPLVVSDFRDGAVGFDNKDDLLLQGNGQLLVRSDIEIGDGTRSTYFDASGQSMEFPTEYSLTRIKNWQFSNNLKANSVGLSVYAKSTDTIYDKASILSATVEQNLSFNASSSTSAAYSVVGTSFIGLSPTLKTGIDVASATFSRCDVVNASGANLTDCTIVSTTSTGAALSVTTNNTLTRVTIDVTGTSAAYHLELGTSVTAITLVDVTFTGTPGTDKVHVLKTTGTVTITTSGTTTLVAGDVTTEGATVSIVAPTLERGQNFTGLIAGSKVKVFTSGTQTVLYGTDSSGTTFAWDDATAGSITVDYTIQQAGYIPIRVTGVVLTGAVGTGQIDTPINQAIDRAWVASSGLTYGTTAVVTVGTNPTTNPGTKTFQLTTASTGQNWYSFWIEQWIDKGDTGEALANVAFPLAANGPNSFSLTNGWTFSDGATSIANLSRDGLRYLNTSGVATAIWAAILTVGVPSGARVRYQQSDGGTTQQAAITSGNMDELVQILSDPNGDGNYADGYDRRGYLVLKVQEAGYDQIEVNAISLYGNLEDQLYVVGLTPTANGIATGDPALTITITDHGATPVTWNGKDFSITITDNATPSSGTDIMRELRYNFEAGGTYQGKDGFNWHDLVQTNGSDFKTVRGAVYGDVGASSKGVRVVMNDGTTPHPDFTLFTADDGTTYAPPVTADVNITGMPNAGAVPTRLQIINSTAVSASAWVANTVYATGAMVKRTTGLGSESTAGLYFRATTGGTSHAVTEPTWNTTPGGTTSDGTVTWTTYKVLFYDADPAGTSYTTTYTDGNEFISGETVTARFAEMNGATSFKTYSGTTLAASTGFAFDVAEEADDVYATNALDGSAYETTFSPNFTLDYIVLDTNTDFSGKAAYAYFCYTLTTSAGMYEFWGGVTALDTGNYRIETDVLNLYFDESGGFVKQTDDVRIYRKDGARPAIDPTTGGYGIEINWRTPVSVVETGVSGLTGPESAQLMSLPNASTVASEVLSSAQSTPIYADVRKVTGTTITGTGTEIDPWGP